MPTLLASRTTPDAHPERTAAHGGCGPDLPVDPAVGMHAAPLGPALGGGLRRGLICRRRGVLTVLRRPGVISIGVVPAPSVEQFGLEGDRSAELIAHAAHDAGGGAAEEQRRDWPADRGGEQLDQ